MGQDLQSLASILWLTMGKSHPVWVSGDVGNFLPHVSGGRKRVRHIGKFPPLALPSRWLARRVVFVCFHHGMSTPSRLSWLVTSSFSVTARGLRCSETSNNSARMKKNRYGTSQILINPISVYDVEHNTNFDEGFFVVLKASTVFKFLVLFNLRTLKLLMRRCKLNTLKAWILNSVMSRKLTKTTILVSGTFAKDLGVGMNLYFLNLLPPGYMEKLAKAEATPSVRNLCTILIILIR